MVNKSHSNYLHKPLIQSKKVRTMSPDFFIIRKQLDRNLSHEKHCKKIVLKSRMRSIAKKNNCTEISHEKHKNNANIITQSSLAEGRFIWYYILLATAKHRI